MAAAVDKRRSVLVTLTAVVIAIMGIALTAGGIWLVLVGGSLYYLIAGVVLLLTAWLLILRRAEALWLYSALLLATMGWAIWEVGLDFWSLAPRGDILVPLGIWLLFPFIAARLSPGWRSARWALVAVLAVAAVVLGVSLSADRFDLAGTLGAARASAVPADPAAAAPAKVDWTAYGGNAFG